MVNLEELALFTRVVEAGGFAAASRRSGIPKSRLSRRVAVLESRLGVRLIQRSTRRFAVTPVGEIVYGHAQKMVSEAEAAEAAVNESLAEPSGLVRISASLMMGELVLAGLIAEFMQIHPKVRIVLSLSDRFVDLVAERFDLAIRASSGPLTNSELVARRIWETQLIVVASPEFLARHGPPTAPGDLAGAPCICLGNADLVRKWQFAHPESGAAVEWSPEPHLVLDNLIGAAQAAARGLGFAYVPDYTCHRELADGTLVQTLAEWSQPAGPVFAIYPSRRGLTSATRMLIEFLASRFATIERRP